MRLFGEVEEKNVHCTWHRGGMVLIWFALIGSGDKLCDAVVEYGVFPLAPNGTAVVP